MVQRDRKYTLKIYDTPLMDIHVEADEYGRFTATVDSVDDSKRSLFPLLLLEPTAENAKAWLNGRTVPKNRKFVDKILEAAGLSLSDKIGILDTCKGLSVNDAYWLDNGSSKISFQDVNLYDNQLDETLAFIAYTGYSSSQKHKLGLSTEWTTDGQFPKAWRRINDKLYLFKAGSSGYANSGMEPYSEYLAAQVAEQMGIPHVPYDLQQWKGKLASVCPLMNSKDIAFVPFWVASKQSRFPAPLAAAMAFSEETFEQLRSMIVFDALIGNQDRHASNYGMLRDNHTGKVIGPAPLFDHNLSLFARDMEVDYPNFLERIDTVIVPATSQLTFTEEAEIVMGAKQHEQLRKMIGFEFKNHPDYPISENRLAALNSYIAGRTKELMKLPVVDEAVLRKSMEKEALSFREPIPMVEVCGCKSKGRSSLSEECRDALDASHKSDLNRNTGKARKERSPKQGFEDHDR